MPSEKLRGVDDDGRYETCADARKRRPKSQFVEWSDQPSQPGDERRHPRRDGRCQPVLPIEFLKVHCETHNRARWRSPGTHKPTEKPF